MAENGLHAPGLVLFSLCDLLTLCDLGIEKPRFTSSPLPSAIFLVTFCLQKRWEDSTELPITPPASPISYVIKILHYRGTFVMTKKLNIGVLLLTTLQTLFEHTGFPINVLFLTQGTILHFSCYGSLISFVLVLQALPGFGDLDRLGQGQAFCRMRLHVSLSDVFLRIRLGF